MKNLSKYYVPFLFIFIFMFTTFSNTISANAAEDISSNLKNKIVPLKTVNPKDDLQDLMPLKATLKDKQIIGMGEATHGTSEFFQMKHRMFKFLVEEMGFRALAIEGLFDDCQVINNYILNGIGNEDSLMSLGTLKFWNSCEVKDLIHWMREYNLKADDNNKIRFYGFDMQSFHSCLPEINSYLQKIDSPLKQEFYNTFNTKIKDFDAAYKLINNLIKEFETSKDSLIKKYSVSEYELVLKYLDIMKQLFDNAFSPSSTDEFRDNCMAKNIKWIVDKETSLGHGKVMLWAHNVHINNHIGVYTSKNSNTSIVHYMGNRLNDMYGNKYYSIGFDFFKGRFNARDTKTNKKSVFTINESNHYTLGYMLNKVNEPIFFSDFKSILQDSEINNYFSQKNLYINSIGESYGEDRKNSSFFPVNSDSMFDALIFIKETTEYRLYNTQPNK